MGGGYMYEHDPVDSRADYKFGWQEILF